MYVYYGSIEKDLLAIRSQMLLGGWFVSVVFFKGPPLVKVPCLVRVLWQRIRTVVWGFDIAIQPATRKKGSLNSNFNSERNFADVSTRSSLLSSVYLEHLVETSRSFFLN